jgi:hypothetical protein
VQSRVLDRHAQREMSRLKLKGKCIPTDPAIATGTDVNLESQFKDECECSFEFYNPFINNTIVGTLTILTNFRNRHSAVTTPLFSICSGRRLRFMSNPRIFNVRFIFFHFQFTRQVQEWVATLLIDDSAHASSTLRRAFVLTVDEAEYGAAVESREMDFVQKQAILRRLQI